MSKLTSTDVKHSIAGYYYQLLIACEELVYLLKNNDSDSYVAIEKGADVRIFDKNDLSIEAKFYKVKQFTKNSNAIRHTLYNFSLLFKKYLNVQSAIAPTYLFKTNVSIGINDKQFFDDWHNNSIADYKLYLEYVKNSLVYESIQRKPIKEKYEEFKKKCSSTCESENDYYKELIQEISKDSNLYSEYINPDRYMTDKEIIKLINSVSFSFNQNAHSKSYVIDDIKKTIYQELKDFKLELTDKDCLHICNIIMELFFESTYNDKLENITKGKLVDIIENHHKYNLKYLNDQEIIKSIKTIERNLKLFDQRLSREKLSDDMKEKIIWLVIDIKEKLFFQMEKYGYSNLAGRYIMGEEAGSNTLIDMLKPFCEVAAFSKKDLGNLVLEELGGMNNFMFSEHRPIAIKSTSSSEEKADEHTLLGTFFHDVGEKNQFGKLDSTELILFDCSAHCKPCQYDKDSISDIVFDIADTTQITLIQEYYQSLEFRCSHCLSYKSNEKCDLAIELKG